MAGETEMRRPFADAGVEIVDRGVSSSLKLRRQKVKRPGFSAWISTSSAPASTGVTLSQRIRLWLS